MKQEEMGDAKHLLGKMCGYERSEVLGRFDSIPKEVKKQALDTLSAKEDASTEEVLLALVIGSLSIGIGTTKKKMGEKELAVWAENNLNFLDSHLRPLEFSLFREAVMRATGPA